ncbi:MAG: sigma 54-interacting transcriptional regulator [Myxococcota bacterium]|nr:sigma 54-interacting transcriptional regulator [Myxococcota bacterium]
MNQVMSPHQTQPLLLPESSPTHQNLSGPPGLVVKGRRVPVPRRRPLVVGSGPDCDLWVDDPFVSSQHAQIRWSGDGVVVQDMGSTNGVRNRGKQVESARVPIGGAFLLGRLPVLVAEDLASARYPGVVRWQGMVARSRASLLSWGEVAATAETSLPVWLHGESGTGKELVARALHQASPRQGGPFVALNCAALPPTLAEAELFGVRRGAFTGAERSREGVFSQANGGTLLLDEIGDLPLDLQGKLLRVLETGVVRPVGSETSTPVDVRVIAASWRDLGADARDGAFRFDLLQRLGILKVSLPPLRTRRTDIGPLLELFLSRSLSPALWPEPPLMRDLEAQPWPGNVRQLRAHALRAGALGRAAALTPADGGGLLPAQDRRKPLGTMGQGAAMARVRGAISACGGNRAEAARSLGVSRSTLYRWLAEERGSGAAASETSPRANEAR